MRRTLVAASLCAVCLPACAGAAGPTHRPVDPFAQPVNVAHGSPEAPRVEVGRLVTLQCLAVPAERKGTFELYALYLDGSILVDATPLVRVDSPSPGWTSRFLVPARGALRTPEESGFLPRLAMVHYADGDRNKVTVLRWTGGAYVGAGSQFALAAADPAP
jgi:hypothetical protein